MRRLSCLLWLALVESAVGQPRPDPAGITLVRAVVTTSISRNSEPRRPLRTLKLPSAVFYYVEADGFQPGAFFYQVRVVVLDGAGKVVGEHHFGTRAAHVRHSVSFPVILRETHAPGTWTLRMYIDTKAPASRLVAETRIEASADGGQALGERLERYAPLLALMAIATFAYVGYGLYAHRRFEVRSVARPEPVAPTRAAGPGDPSLWALVVANLVPLGLAVWGGANAADILFLYWVENLVVLFYAILRMISARGAGAPRLLGDPGDIGLVFQIPLLVMLFVIYSSGHAAVLWYLVRQHSTLFALDPRGMLDPPIAAEFERTGRGVWDVVPFAMVVQATALFVSHGISFVRNYLDGGEYRLATPKDEMTRPLNRVWAMHIAAVVMGFIASSAGSPLAMLFVLVLVKTGFDAGTHLRLHRSPARPA